MTLVNGTSDAESSQRSQTSTGGDTSQKLTPRQILAMELLGESDVTSLRSSGSQPLLPAILESPSEGRDGASIVGNPTTVAPVVDRPILDIDRSSKSDANLYIKTLPADDIALDEFYIKWEGTNIYTETDTGKKLSKETMEELIRSRSRIENSIKENSYDPLGWLLLSGVYYDLCYSDLQVSAAYKALLLVSFGLNFNGQPLGHAVRVSVGKRLSCSVISSITQELEVMKLNAYVTLLRGLHDAASYYDGLNEAKEALKLYPGNQTIIAIKEMLRKEYAIRVDSLKNINATFTDHQERYSCQCGRMNKKKYPWMDEKLFIRTPANLAAFNRGFNSKNCEIRPLRYPSLASSHETNHENDVGPLGIFATQDIHQGEILLLDHNTTLVSNIPPSKMTQCEACHASIHPCFFEPSEVRVANCCKAVSYCSAACHDLATNGYHQVLCGQDFKWLYESTSEASASGEDDASWRPLVLLRLLAIIISDLKSISEPASRPHPLQHPLVARLTANYTAGNSSEQEWNYFSHVVAPNRILMQLGVDVFSDFKWSAEVIHTLYWRMVTNACKIRSPVMAEARGCKIIEYAIVGISPGYVFFNHGCKPNVGWMPGGDGYGRHLLAESQLPDRKKAKIGGSAIVCMAMIDLWRDEELRISYVPEGHESALARWIDGICECRDCWMKRNVVDISDGNSNVSSE